MNNSILMSFLCVLLGTTISCGSKTPTVIKGAIPTAKQIEMKNEKQEEIKPVPKESAGRESSGLIFPYTANGVVARVGGEEISAEAFNNRLKRIFPPIPKMFLCICATAGQTRRNITLNSCCKRRHQEARTSPPCR